MNGIAYFIYNGKSSLDYGLRIHNKNEVIIPKRAYDIHQMSGENGLMISDLGYYEPIEKVFYCTIEPIDQDVNTQIERIYRWLNEVKGFNPLAISFEQGFYYRAVLNEVIQIDTSYAPFAELGISFLCHPLRFLNEGKKPLVLTSSTMLHNLGSEESMPRLEINLSSLGNFSFSIEAERGAVKRFAFKAPSASKIIIDSQSYEIVDSRGNPLYRFAEFWDFPKLPQGRFEIKWDSVINTIELIPRWCKL